MPSEFAVIFDMDGVLVDSYETHYQSWVMLCEEIDYHYPREQFEAGFGRTSREVLEEHWADIATTPEKIEEFANRKEDFFRQLIHDDFPAMPGATDLVLSLRAAGFRTAVGSSGPPENVEFVLDRLNLRDAMSVRVTGSDVKIGKPHPEVFLKAAGKLGISPERCAVVEDAPVGIEAAHAGGMKCVGFASTGRTRQQLHQADIVIDGLAELSPQRFEKLITGQA